MSGDLKESPSLELIAFRLSQVERAVARLTAAHLLGLVLLAGILGEKVRMLMP